MAEGRPESFFSRLFHRRAPESFNSIPVAIIDPGIVKFVVVEIHSDQQKRFSKFIVRAFQPTVRVGDDVTSTDDLLDGPNDFVLLKLEAEMERVGVDFNVIGWGKVNHNVKNSSMTFYEEEDVVQDKFESHSQQCFIARQLVKTGYTGKVYVTYHVLKNGSHSPKSSRRLQRLKAAARNDVQA